MDGLSDSSEEPPPISITRKCVSLGTLRAVGWRDADDPARMSLLAAWHLAAFGALAGSLLFTPEQARRWLLDRVLAQAGRALFWVRDVRGVAVGHLGVTGSRIGDRLAAEPAPELFAAAEESLAHWAGRAEGVTSPAP